MQKQTTISLVLVLLASALLGSSLLTRGHFWGDDFAAYIMQAKSILSWSMDDFVEANTFTITQSSSRIGPVAYPWGYPLMLVPAYAIKGLSPLALKLPGLGAFLGFLLSFFLLMNRRMTAMESLLATALFAFNPVLLSFLDNILSDIPFLFLSTLSILLTDACIYEERKKRKLVLAAATGASILAAFLVRTQGIVLLGSVLLYQAIRFLQHKRDRGIILDTLVIAGIFGVLWIVSVLIFPGGQSSYFALYNDLSLSLLRGNMLSYIRLFGDFFAGLPGSSLIYALVLLLSITGMVARFKEDLLFVIYFWAYLVVLWTWPAWQGLRFLFPLLPFFIYFAFQGVSVLLHVFGGKGPNLSRIVVYTMWIILSITFIFISSRSAYFNLTNQRSINGPFDPYSIQVYNFVKDKTPPDSIIVFFKPRAMRLMTGHDTLASTQCEHMPRGDYLVLSKKVGENLQIPPERIQECELPLESRYKNRRFIVYEILGAAP